MKRLTIVLLFVLVTLTFLANSMKPVPLSGHGGKVMLKNMTNSSEGITWNNVTMVSINGVKNNTTVEINSVKNGTHVNINLTTGTIIANNTTKEGLWVWGGKPQPVPQIILDHDAGIRQIIKDNRA
jgi:hypothetical protein